MKNVILAILIVLFGLYSCNNKSVQNSTTRQESGGEERTALELPEVPKELTTPVDRANFLITHYWDNFDFSDTTYIHLPDITEQALANYVQILPIADKNIAEQSIAALLDKAEHQKTHEMYSFFKENLNKYLYDPNSFMRNEEYYIPVAKYILTDSATGEVEKEKTKFKLEMMEKNRPGQIAADITYTLSSGKTGTLHKLDAGYTLLMFYNPDCHSCAENIDYLKQSPIINKIHESGGLKVLAFYPDTDLSIWQKHLKDIPPLWINGYDKNQTITNKKVYDLKAIPTLYLLDKDKRVLLKDATVQKIELYLRDHNPMLFSD